LGKDTGGVALVAELRKRRKKNEGMKKKQSKRNNGVR